jgi:hypothetical protein
MALPREVNRKPAARAIAGPGLAIIHSLLILLKSATISLSPGSSLISFSISLRMTDILFRTPILALSLSKDTNWIIGGVPPLDSALQNFTLW